MIPLSEPKLSGNEWVYIKECLDTNWVSSVGSYVDRFENDVASYVGRQYGVACVNGTAALHVALRVLGVGENDEVIMPTLTFIASANAVRYLGAWPVLIDVSSDSWQMDMEALRRFLSQECESSLQGLKNTITGRIVKAILPVHILGYSVDMEELMCIARQYGLSVVEDVAEALGAYYKGKPVGSYADIACFSFNGNKVITSGAGGMVCTDNKALADKVRYLTTQAKDDALEYIHEEIGYNYRLSNIQAAMGVAQMEVLDYYIEKKRFIAKQYQKALSDIKGLICAPDIEGASYWLYTVLIDSNNFGLSSRTLIAELQRHDIQARPLWRPMHQLKPFADACAYDIKVADELYQQAVSLPSSIGLSEEDQNKVISVIKKVAN